MKKITVFAIAIASMAMAMTSCNKEEHAFTREIKVSVEQNEATNAAKTYIVHDETESRVYWETGDTLTIFDENCYGNIYLASVNGEDCSFIFKRKCTTEDMDETSNTLFAYYPYRMGTTYRNAHWMRIPRKQTSVSGEFKDFPMFAQGPITNLVFKNTCGIIRFKLTGTERVDSIAISTEKYINGSFDANYNSADDNILTPRENKVFGTTDIVLHMTSGAQATTQGKEVNMYMLPGTYEIFNITFFSGNRSYTVRNTVPITIQRSAINDYEVELTAAKFHQEVYGTTNALFSVGSLGNAYIAKGNLMFVGGVGNYDKLGHIWNIHTNGFDGIGDGSYITNEFNTSSEYVNLDVYAWGANMWYNPYGASCGNHTPIFRLNLYAVNAYPYLNSNTTLASNNDKAANAKVNADNTLAWRTPTEAQMQEILDNNEHKMITLSFLNGRTITGMVIVPAYSTLALSAIPETVTTKSQWNAIEKAGCAFLPVLYHRIYKTSGRWNNGLGDKTSSYYQLADSYDANNTPVLKLETSGASFETVHKACGSHVRPIIMVPAAVAE